MGVRGGGSPALAGTREYEQSDRNRKQAEGGLRCLWNLECPVRLSQNTNMCAFQLRKFWRNLDGPPKDRMVELRSMF